MVNIHPVTQNGSFRGRF